MFRTSIGIKTSMKNMPVYVLVVNSSNIYAYHERIRLCLFRSSPHIEIESTDPRHVHSDLQGQAKRELFAIILDNCMYLSDVLIFARHGHCHLTRRVCIDPCLLNLGHFEFVWFSSELSFNQFLSVDKICRVINCVLFIIQLGAD